MKWIVVSIYLFVAGFFLVGFMDTFEPDAPNAVILRILSALAVLASLAGIVIALRPRPEHRE
jgi:hypothetical protein